MVSPGGIGRVHEAPGSGSILLMDYAPTVAAMAKLIERMDGIEESRRPVATTIELRHAEAEVLAVTLSRALVDPPQGPPKEGAPEPLPRIVAYGPRNALVVRGTAADVERVRALVKDLDQPPKQWTAVEPRPGG